MARQLRDRIVEQFSGEGDRADVWRVLDLAVDTDAYLNLGYSARCRSHLIGQPQRRLVDVVGRALVEELPSTGAGDAPAAGVRLLDVGCGRGGPAVRLADRFGFDVVGLDLVAYNVARARATAAESGVDAAFLVGDVTRPPVREGAVDAATAVDSLAYVPDRPAALSAVGDALEPGGVLALSDLMVAPDATPAEREAVAAFADAWDMPPLDTPADYERALADAGFELRARRDLTPNSVGRFRRYTTPALWLLSSPASALVERFLRARDADPETVVEQVRAAHRALPHLRHVLLVAGLSR